VKGALALAGRNRWLLVTVVSSTLVISGCGMCSNRKIGEYPDPSGRLKLVVFDRDCGATTGFSTQASLVKSTEELPRGAGDVFIADTNHGTAPAGPDGGPELRVRWVDAHHLILAYHARARVFSATTRARGVSIQFEIFD
jgi:hypothetical protein